MQRTSHPMISRILALFAPLLVALTIWVPIRFTGGDRVFPNETLPVYGVLALPVVIASLGMAVLFWLPRIKAWLALAASACLLFGIGVLPFLKATGGCWDGQDAEGRPIGNCVTSAPWFGLAAIAGALACMAIAVVASFVDQRQPPRDQYRQFVPPTQR